MATHLPVPLRRPHMVGLSFKLLASLFLLCSFPGAEAIHHMTLTPDQNVTSRSENVPLRITNLCAETIWPGIGTQHGTGPSTQGFELSPGESKDLMVSANWQGRVWGRTNCTFNEEGTGPSDNGGANGAGKACLTGDCNGMLDCVVTGDVPTTLAEYTLMVSGQTFYDISVVDGYNLPMAIVSLNNESGIASLMEIPPNLTNPVCIATAAQLAEQGSTLDEYLGSNASYPLPLEQSVSYDFVQSWCPWDLQKSPPTTSANGVYPYPDGTLERPAFNPCYSTCAKYNTPQFCCTEPYNSPSACKPTTYSKMAKKVCPDAYSFAFDDQSSTFIVPAGGGFEVIFCPAGRSTNILATSSAQLQRLAALAYVQA